MTPAKKKTGEPKQILPPAKSTAKPTRQGPVVVRSGVYSPEEILAIQHAHPEGGLDDKRAATASRQPMPLEQAPSASAPAAVAPTPFTGLKGVLERLKATSSIAKMVEARRSNDKSAASGFRQPSGATGEAAEQSNNASDLKSAPYPQAIRRMQLPLPQSTTHAPAVAAASTAVAELRGAVPKPVFRKAICIITKNLNGLHVMLGKPKTVRSTDQFFRVGKHSFLLDIGRAFMVGPRGAYVMYDIDVAEPIERVVLDRRGNPTATHAPLEFGDQVHYSEPLDMTLQSKVFEQAFRALGEGNAFNYMWIVMLLVGAVLGYFMGNTFPANKAVTVVTTTTTAGKMLAGLIWK